MNTNILRTMPFKKILAGSLATFVVMALMYSMVEPQVASAVNAGSNVTVSLFVDTGISLSTSGNQQLSTDLGATSNIAIGTTTLTVATNDPNGYSMTVTASTTPAMKSGTDSIPDFASTTPGLWYSAAGTTQFGFSVFGSHSPTGTWGTGSFCNGSATSTVNTTLKYRGYSTSPVTIASTNATTTPTGVTTTMCYAVQQNGTYVPAGAYSATLTVTATAT